MVNTNKLFSRGLLLITALSTSLWSVASDEVSMITSNSNIWSHSPRDVAQRFADLNWKSSGHGYQATSAQGLLFWDQQINSVDVEGAQKTKKLSINIYKKSKGGELGNTSFKAMASSWKQMLDAKSGVSGVPLSKMRQDGREIQYVTWKLTDSTVVLSAEWQKDPESLSVDIFPHSYGRQLVTNLKTALKATKSTTAKPKVANSRESLIGKALKRQTYFLERSQFKKKDISGNPEYYLVYFSASW